MPPHIGEPRLSVACVGTSPPGGAPGGLLRRVGGALAHHVNNALTGLIGQVELALRQAPPGSPGHEHLVASLSHAFQAAAAVREVVRFTRQAPGPPDLAPVCLRRLVEEFAVRLRASGGPALAVVVQAEGEGWGRACPAWVEAALEAVVANALEAMPGGGTLTLRVEEAGERGIVRVRDSGAGIGPGDRARLFEPFWTTKSGGHLGLGLALCRETVEALGGSVQVSSAAGQGTTVALSFPAE